MIAVESSDLPDFDIAGTTSGLVVIGYDRRFGMRNIFAQQAEIDKGAVGNC
jgi:hypothetical protein